MAAIIINIEGKDGEKAVITEPLYFELCTDIDVPCDGLRLRFTSGEKPFEINRITVMLNGEKVFYGLCDRQEYSADEKGFNVFIYARSSAALLVDNEASPCAYCSPSVNVLYHAEAKTLGFKNRLPDLVCRHDYTVEKGTSCYASVNEFVKTLTGRNIRINCDNELVIPDGKNTVLLDGYTVLSESRRINRYKPITQIDYKINGDASFCRHIKSRTAESLNIQRRRKLNVSSLPMWQQEYALNERICDSLKGYTEVRIVLDGCNCFELYSEAVYRSSKLGSLDGYRLKKVTVIKNANGEKTALTFTKTTEAEAISYVAK
ncbi:MAG: hypothetical protein E7571_01670 [Ruminococcaceae bacterium]|nr:hypothetical protein [Oscillospiraceae bacterium]